MEKQAKKVKAEENRSTTVIGPNLAFDENDVARMLVAQMLVTGCDQLFDDVLYRLASSLTWLQNAKRHRELLGMYEDGVVIPLNGDDEQVDMVQVDERLESGICEVRGTREVAELYDLLREMFHKKYIVEMQQQNQKQQDRERESE